MAQIHKEDPDVDESSSTTPASDSPPEEETRILWDEAGPLTDENFRIASAKAREAIDALLRIAEAVEPFDAKRVAAEALDTIAKLGHGN